jgi:hypothetical protein
LVLTAAATVKPFLCLPLSWVAYRRPSTLGTIAGVALLLPSVGSLVHGLDTYRAWYRDLQTAAPLGHWANGSISSALALSFSPSPWFSPIVLAPSVIVPLWITLSAFLAFDFWWWSRRASTDQAWLGALMVAFLVSPRSWVFAAWFLMGPAIAVAFRDRWRSPKILVAASLLLLPAGIGTIGQPNRVFTVLAGSIYTWAWALLYLAARTQARADAARRA